MFTHRNVFNDSNAFFKSYFSTHNVDQQFTDPVLQPSSTSKAKSDLNIPQTTFIIQVR